jgi:hypothetical protein
VTVECGDNCVRQRKVHELADSEKIAVLQMMRVMGHRRLTCVEVTEHIDQHIRDNRRFSTDETA